LVQPVQRCLHRWRRDLVNLSHQCLKQDRQQQRRDTNIGKSRQNVNLRRRPRFRRLALSRTGTASEELFREIGPAVAVVFLLQAIRFSPAPARAARRG
jgi:hypothetical protein